MDLLQNRALLVWAVWRSLDDKTGTQGGEGRMTAIERLAHWRRLRGQELMDAVREVYLRNSSMRQTGHPWVRLFGKGIIKTAKFNNFYKTKDASVVAALTGTCDGFAGVRDRALLAVLWELLWSQGRRNLSAVVDIQVKDLRWAGSNYDLVYEGGIQRLNETSSILKAWIEQGNITGEAVFRDIVGGGGASIRD